MTAGAGVDLGGRADDGRPRAVAGGPGVRNGRAARSGEAGGSVRNGAVERNGSRQPGGTGTGGATRNGSTNGRRPGAVNGAERRGQDGRPQRPAGDGRRGAARNRPGGAPTRGGRGPYDEDDLDPERPDGADRTDFGALRLPVPAGGVVDVEPSTQGKLQAVHIMLPQGRLSVSALAAPTTDRLWPALAKEINQSLRDGGARVRWYDGRWGRELRARTGGALSVFIGIDGPRWMVYGVATGPEKDARALDRELRRVLGETVVVRGTAPYPVRTVLPLTLPDDLQAEKDARLERERAAAAALEAQQAAQEAAQQTTQQAAHRGEAASGGPAGAADAAPARAAAPAGGRGSAEPVPAEPRRAEPRRAEPRRAEPMRAEPRRTEPMRTEPMRAEPEPVEAAPAAEAAPAEPVRPVRPVALGPAGRNGAVHPAGPPAGFPTDRDRQAPLAAGAGETSVLRPADRSVADRSVADRSAAGWLPPAGETSVLPSVDRAGRERAVPDRPADRPADRRGSGPEIGSETSVLRPIGGDESPTEEFPAVRLAWAGTGRYQDEALPAGEAPAAAFPPVGEDREPTGRHGRAAADDESWVPVRHARPWSSADGVDGEPGDPARISGHPGRGSAERGWVDGEPGEPAWGSGDAGWVPGDAAPAPAGPVHAGEPAWTAGDGEPWPEPVTAPIPPIPPVPPVSPLPADPAPAWQPEPTDPADDTDGEPSGRHAERGRAGAHAAPALSFLGGDPMALFSARPPGRHRRGD